MLVRIDEIRTAADISRILAEFHHFQELNDLDELVIPSLFKTYPCDWQFIANKFRYKTPLSMKDQWRIVLTRIADADRDDCFSWPVREP